MKTESIIVRKTYSFAIEIIVLYKHLVNVKREFVLSKQLLRSGTSIGANVNEGVAAISKKDFVYKLSISVKEARETIYWLNLLRDSEYIDNIHFEKICNSCIEILRILNSIILTTKKRYFNNTRQ